MAKRRIITDERKHYVRDWTKEHYKLINIAFRKDDDSDIISDLEEAKKAGISNHEWLRQLFEAYKEK